MTKNLTEGSEFSVLVRFSLPYLLSCFLQTFYGLADLFIIGQFNDAVSISAVSVGSQITHMITVIVAGLAMGTTVSISRAVGAGNKKDVSRCIGNSVSFFAIIAVFFTALLLFTAKNILSLIATPQESFNQTLAYCAVCFAGLPFIIAYNVVSSIFRGTGDSKTPMYVVILAGILNIALDYVFIGGLGMAAKGAALATVISQGVSVALALLFLKKSQSAPKVLKSDLRFNNSTIKKIVNVGLPIALQDGLIQVSFLVITAIANSRGVVIAASVGIVEKIICFVFLVPSAMLSSVSAIAAQNAGAGKHDRAKRTLRYAILVCIVFGTIVATLCQICPESIIAIFAQNEPEVCRMGAQYLRAYIIDCIFAGVHFCFSGYFCAYKKSFYSFIHNILSILLFRIPGAYFASVHFPKTLFPMGLAAPLGSLFSVALCTILFLILNSSIKNEVNSTNINGELPANT